MARFTRNGEAKNFKQYSNNLIYGGNYDNGGQI